MTQDELKNAYDSLLEDSRNVTARRIQAVQNKANASANILLATRRVSTALANADTKVRAMAEAMGKKTTEASIKNEVALDPTVAEAEAELDAHRLDLGTAEAEIEICRAIDRDIAIRAQYLNSLAALMRDELRATLLAP